MKRFEYLVLDFDRRFDDLTKVTEALNKLGALGWRCSSTSAAQQYQSFTMERELNGQPETILGSTGPYSQDS